MFRWALGRGRPRTQGICLASPIVAAILLASLVGSSPLASKHPEPFGAPDPSFSAPSLGSRLAASDLQLPAKETSLPVSPESELLGVDASSDLLVVASPNEGEITWVHGTTLVGDVVANASAGASLDIVGAYDNASSTFFVGFSDSFTYSQLNGTILAFQGTAHTESYQVPLFTNLAFDPSVGGLLLALRSNGVDLLNANGSLSRLSIPPVNPGNATSPPPPPPPPSPNGEFGPMLFDSLEGTMYIATNPVDGTNATILVLNRTLGATLVSTNAGGIGSISLWEDNATDDIFVASATSDSVTVLHDGALARVIQLPGPAWAGTFDAKTGFSYALDIADDSVFVLNGTSTVATIPLGEAPGSLAENSASGQIYITEPVADAVAVLDGTDLQGTFPGGDRPGAALFDPSGGILYVLDGAAVLAIRPGGDNSLGFLVWTSIVGGVALGAALIGVSIWYYRSRRAKPAPRP